MRSGLIAALAFISSISWANSELLTCPDGRQISTKLKGDKAQHAATANLDIERVKRKFTELPGWGNNSELKLLYSAMQNNCTAQRLPSGWKRICPLLSTVEPQDITAFIEDHFTPYQIIVEGSDTGKFTSYYAPYLNVSKTKHDQYQYPLYRGSALATTLSRTEIDAGALPDSEAIFWTDSYMDAFFLGIQGSGVGKFENGNKVSILFHSKNIYDYVSPGRPLIKCGDVAPEIMSLPAIKDWIADASETEVRRLISNNQRYTFYTEEHYEGQMPVGALNVRLTPMHSMAVDKPKNLS